jgi:hypothetical protein
MTVINDEELDEMSIAKYDGFGTPHAYHYEARFEYEGSEYAAFYSEEEDIQTPVILRIEGRRLVDVTNPKEEALLQAILTEWEEEWDSTGENAQTH